MGVEDVDVLVADEATEANEWGEVGFVARVKMDDGDAGAFEVAAERCGAVEAGDGDSPPSAVKLWGEGDKLAFGAAEVELGDEVEDVHAR